MWRCWVGFNATHSLGLILFGLIFGFLAAAHSELLFHSPFLLVIGLAALGGFVVLSKIYFFSAPFAGVSISWRVMSPVLHYRASESSVSAVTMLQISRGRQSWVVDCAGGTCPNVPNCAAHECNDPITMSAPKPE